MRKLRSPKGVPERVVRSVRDASVETCLVRAPIVASTNSLRKAGDIIVGIGITEGLSDGVIKVLAIDKGDGTLLGGVSRQNSIGSKAVDYSAGSLHTPTHDRDTAVAGNFD